MRSSARRFAPKHPLPRGCLLQDHVTQPQIDDQTVAAVLRNEKTVYLSGCASYDDGIWWWHPSPRYTEFCKMFVPQSAGNYGVLGDFEDCPTGNTAN